MSWPHRLFAGQFTDFELKLLRVFRVVVVSGGFSAAEAEIGLTKSAISEHVSDLEIRLGVRLCETGHGGFALTEEGKVVYEAITQLPSTRPMPGISGKIRRRASVWQRASPYMPVSKWILSPILVNS